MRKSMTIQHMCISVLRRIRPQKWSFETSRMTSIRECPNGEGHHVPKAGEKE
jgi:hypothetical protein